MARSCRWTQNLHKTESHLPSLWAVSWLHWITPKKTAKLSRRYNHTKPSDKLRPLESFVLLHGTRLKTQTVLDDYLNGIRCSKIYASKEVIQVAKEYYREPAYHLKQEDRLKDKAAYY